MARLDAILDSHSMALEKLTEKEARQFLKTYKSVAHELERKIVNARTDDAGQRARIMLAQVGHGITDLEVQLGGSLDGSVRLAKLKALDHLTATIRKAEPALGETVGVIEVGALQRLHGDLALHRYSIETYGRAIGDALRRDIVRSTAMGEGIHALEKRLRSTLVGSKLESRAWLIARMELSRAYNDSTLAGIEEADQVLPGGMMKKIHDARDRRNHPFSRATHGVVAKAGEAFQVPAAAVAAAGASMGKGIGGILWDRKGAFYVGSNLPAHFGERGRIVPWRKAWDPAAEKEKDRATAVKKAEEKQRERDRERAAKQAKADKRNARRRANAAAKRVSKVAAAEGPKTLSAAKKSLREAKEKAAALGINPHEYAGSYALETKNLRALQAATKNPSAAPGSAGWMEARAALREAQRHGGGVPVPVAGLAEFVAKKEAEFAAREAVTVAYRELVSLAPREWQEKERLRWYRALLRGNGPRVPRAHRERYDRALATSLRQFRPDQLRLLVADGEEIVHSAANRRAHASPRWGLGYSQPGYVKQDLRGLYGNYRASKRSSETLAHELGHRLDGVMSGRSDSSNGWPWVARPGYTDAPKQWEAAFRGPYEAAKTGGVERLAYRETSSPFHWAGNWVNPYEARIYSGRASSSRITANPSALGGNGGPVEFIAMANSYRTEERFAMVEAALRTKASSRKVWHSLNETIGGSRAVDQSKALAAARLHGPAYRDALEDLYGDGLRLCEELADAAAWGPPGLSRDKDLTATAVLIQGRMGTPLEKSLGPTGPLGRLLSKPAKLDQIRLLDPASPLSHSSALLESGGSKNKDPT